MQLSTETLLPYQEFVDMCRGNWGWAVKYLLGAGNFSILPFQSATLDVFFSHPFILDIESRGASKTFRLGLYSLLRALFDQDKERGCKVVIVSASFRQSKEVFSHIQHFWKISPLIQESCPGGPRTLMDRCELDVGNSSIIALPLGAGDKIRGTRANVVVVDEAASMPETILNVVIRGFVSVAQNPVERVELFKLLKAKKLTSEQIRSMLPKNQLILAGTGYYKFNHLYKTYCRYKQIIDSKIIGYTGNFDTFTDLPPDIYIDYRDYAIIRLPYYKLPEGFLDETQVNNARSELSAKIFAMEYEAEFIDDSDGFFSRRTIEHCTPRINVDLEGQKTFEDNAFEPELESDGKSMYVMGVDPARTQDKAAISIVKILSNKDVYQHVYCKSFHKTPFPQLAEAILDLCERFKIYQIGMDKGSGGGGMAVLDLLQNANMVKETSKIIRPLDNKLDLFIDKPGVGKKILDMINYQGLWLSNANYALQSDLDHARALFPYTIGEERFLNSPEKLTELNKTWEEINATKDEMCDIVMTVTEKGHDPHFDIVGGSNSVKNRRRKDRYSAYLLASDQARKFLKGKMESSVSDDSKNDRATGGWLEEFAR